MVGNKKRNFFLQKWYVTVSAGRDKQRLCCAANLCIIIRFWHQNGMYIQSLYTDMSLEIHLMPLWHFSGLGRAIHVPQSNCVLPGLPGPTRFLPPPPSLDCWNELGVLYMKSSWRNYTSVLFTPRRKYYSCPGRAHGGAMVLVLRTCRGESADASSSAESIGSSHAARR